MSNEAGAENATDAVALALRDLAAAVAELHDWRPVREWVLKGGSESQIPPQLSDLDSYEAAGNALVADERLAVLVDEGTPDRPIVRVGLYGIQLRASMLPPGMIASAIVQCCLRDSFTGWPVPAVLADMIAENLDVLRRIAERKTVVLTCVAGARGVRLGPGQALLETALGTLHSKDAFHLPELAMSGTPDVIISATIRTQVQLLRERDTRWGTDDPAVDAAKQRLSHLRLALLMGSTQAVLADVPDWVRTTITGLAFLLPFAAIPGWLVLTVSGEPAGRDLLHTEQTSCIDAARHLSGLHLDNMQMAIDRFLLAATERTSASDALVDAVVSLDALFGMPGEARLRVGAAVARLLEPDDPAARTQLFKDVGEVYGARSGAVHGNRGSRRSSEGRVFDALRLALRVLSEIFYSAPWLLDIPKSGDRGLALILGNQDHGQPSGNQPPSTAEPATSS